MFEVSAHSLLTGANFGTIFEFFSEAFTQTDQKRKTPKQAKVFAD